MAAGDILDLLARVNLAAAAAIVLVVALRKVARPRFGARLVYGLWLLPMLAAAAVMAPARTVTVSGMAAPPTVAAGAAVTPAFGGVARMGAPAHAAAASLDPATIAVALWLAGVAAAALVMILLQRRFTAEVRKGAIGPAVVGVIAPRIVTPADFERKFSGEEQALVLAHERAHIARQDSRLNGLSAALQCLFWFNPLIHLAAHLMRIDQEMACDETVMTRLPDARRAYAQALVKAQLAIRPLPLGCYWPSGAEHPLVERIAMLKRANLSRRRRLAGASALAVLCAGAGFTAWASQPPQVRIAPGPAAAASSMAAADAPEPAPAPVSTPKRVEARIAKAEAPAAPAAAPPPPRPDVMQVAALEPQPGGDRLPPPGPQGGQPVYARPAGALASPPSFTDSQRETSRDYGRCQREAVKAFDDGRASEDAIATKVEKRCDAEYQTFRQAWSEGGGPGAPDQRAWNLDNGREERARVVVHASRQAMARIADIRSCVRLAADQFSAEPFDRIVDQGVLRCGALVPFPVPPVEATMTEQQLQDRKERQDRMTRTMIASELKQVIGSSPPK